MAVKRKPRAWDKASRDVPRDIWPSGRVKISLGAVTAEEARRRTAALDQLRTWHAWDVIHAIAKGSLPLARVVSAVRERGDAGMTELRSVVEAIAIGDLPTIRVAADQYLEMYKHDRRARSYIQTSSRLKRFCEQEHGDGTVGDVRIDKLTKADIEAALRKVDRAPPTLEAIRLAVSGLFTWWVGDENEAARVESRRVRFAENPASKVAKRETGRRVTTASESQMLKLFASAEIYQTAILRALVHIGFREGELIHTRLHDDLDLRDWIWRVQPRGADPRCPCPDCQGKGWNPKSKRSNRIIKVPSEPKELRASILRYLDLFPCDPGDFVFRNPRTAGVWGGDAFDDDFANLCKRAGVRYGTKVPGGLTPHAMRHTCATSLLRAGVDSAIVAALLGDSLDTIVNTYLHITPDDTAKAVQAGPAYDDDGDDDSDDPYEG